MNTQEIIEKVQNDLLYFYNLYCDCSVPGSELTDMDDLRKRVFTLARSLFFDYSIRPSCYIEAHSDKKSELLERMKKYEETS